MPLLPGWLVKAGGSCLRTAFPTLSRLSSTLLHFDFFTLAARLVEDISGGREGDETDEEEEDEEEHDDDDAGNNCNEDNRRGEDGAAGDT